MWPVFVINLDRMPERMAASSELMRRAGIPFERISACDYQQMTVRDLARVIAPHPPRFAKRAVTAAEAACFLSHRTVWERIAAGSSPGAFVFEDDFEFVPWIGDLLRDISKRPASWDMLKLYSDKTKTLRHVEFLASGERLGVPRIIPMSTLAYAITRPAAAHLAQCSIPFGRPVDLYIKHWWEHGCSVKLVQPSPVWRQASHLATSGIDGSRTAAKRANPAARFLRNIAYQLALEIRTELNRASRPMTRQWPDRAVVAAKEDAEQGA